MRTASRRKRVKLVSKPGASRLYIRSFGLNHPLANGKYNRRMFKWGPPGCLSRSASKFWYKSSMQPCDGGVIASDGTRIVGFVRFYYEPYRGIQAAGTWVEKSVRRSGLAMLMWDKMLNSVKPLWVRVPIASRAGLALYEALKLRHQGLKWMKK